jgi:hypothetical protein
MNLPLTKITLMSCLFLAVGHAGGLAMDRQEIDRQEEDAGISFSSVVRLDKLEPLLGKDRAFPIPQNIETRAPHATAWMRAHLKQLGHLKPTDNEVWEGLRQLTMEEVLEESFIWKSIGTLASIQEGLRQMELGNPDPRNAQILEGLRQKRMSPAIPNPSLDQIQAGLTLQFVKFITDPSAELINASLDEESNN